MAQLKSLVKNKRRTLTNYSRAPSCRGGSQEARLEIKHGLSSKDKQRGASSCMVGRYGFRALLRGLGMALRFHSRLKRQPREGQGQYPDLALRSLRHRQALQGDYLLRRVAKAVFDG